MAELVYSAGLTSKLFWLQESRKTAGYILDGYSKADIRKIAWEENIYQVKAEYRAYEVLNGTLAYFISAIIIMVHSSKYPQSAVSSFPHIVLLLPYICLQQIFIILHFLFLFYNFL